ncbi:hypothetical protein Tco_0226094 [Tanacetum coccineum]
MGRWYSKDSGFELIAYSDADHAGCNNDCKSTSGSIQFLGDKLVSWSSRKQDCTATSTAKAEYNPDHTSLSNRNFVPLVMVYGTTDVFGYGVTQELRSAITQDTKVVDITFLNPWPLESTSNELVWIRLPNLEISSVILVELPKMWNDNRHDFGEKQGYHVKVEIRNFVRNLDIEAVLDWLYEVDEFCDIMDVPKKKLVKIVTYKLHGGVRSCWKHEQDIFMMQGKRPVNTWTRMKRMIKGRLLPQT